MAAPKNQQKTRLAKCCHYCRIITTFLFSHVGLCALVLAYAFGGAFTFHYLESTYEEQVRNNTKAQREELVAAIWELTENQAVLVYDQWINETRSKLAEFEKLIIHAVKNDGFDGNEDSLEAQWSVTGAMLYSIIVITTIGYGNIAPKTPIGRLVTMLYAIVGIPLMLLCLSNIGDVMAHSFKFLYWKVCYTLCIKQKKRKKRRRRRHHRRRRVVNQQPTSSGAFHQGPIECIPMQSMGASVYPTSPGMGIGSSYTLPTPSRRFYQQAVPQFSDHIDANQVPIISNKYALQSDINDEPPEPMYPGFPLYERVTMPYMSGSSTLPHLSRTQLLRPPPLPQPVPFTHQPQEEYEESESYTESEDSDDEDEEEGNVPVFMCLGLVLGYICGGAWLFKQWELNWSYLDSAYFCFVTLTTIGFGDMVPGSAFMSSSGDGRTTLIICALYLLFGMALLAMSFNLVQEEVAKSVRHIGKKIGIVSDDGDKSN